MHFEHFELLHRVAEGHVRARYDLAASDMPPTRLQELGALMDANLGESHIGGGLELRSQLARMYGGRPEDYIVTNGTSEANYAVCAAILEPGEPALVEAPTYQPLAEIPRGLGGTLHRVVRPASTGYRVTADEVRTSMPPGLRLLVLSNLHNPSGALLDETTLRGIADLAAAEGFHLLIDEVFRELAIDREPPSAGGLNERVIATSGVGKAYGAGGLRIGWIRAAEEVRRRIRAVLDYLSVSPAILSERLALALLQQKSKTAERNRRLILEGRKALAEWSAREPRVAYAEPPGHLCFPDVEANTATLADRLLRDHSTSIAPGESFGVPRHIRLNLGCGIEVLEPGLDRISGALRAA